MSPKKLKYLRILFVLLILCLVISAFAVPYAFLSSLNAFKGAFLFWSLFALLVIFLTIKITQYWRDN